MNKLCPHVEIEPLEPPASSRCAECDRSAPTRVCLTCGHVGCCDSSQGHATAHARATDHPGIRPLPLREDGWVWCYACRTYVA